ncbi:hypothetical protein QCA50_006757 [Cerrena zonata]|uniref:Piwi domain-containing protein n=1 Tax=Cerrena zonata TaxID=2478898 RepID=A0AAW0GFW6_9APHY
MQGNRTVTRVHTNHFQITSLPKDNFYQYDVRIEPDAFKARSREIVTKVQAENPRYFTPRAIYDGGKIAFSTNGGIPTTPFVVQLNPRMAPFQVCFTGTGAINLSNHAACVKDGRVIASVINLLQLIVRQAPAMRHMWAVRARSFYTGQGERTLGGGLVAWNGFFQSVRPTINRIMINIDTTTTVMYEAASLLDSASNFLQMSQRDLERLNLESPNGKKLSRFLKKVRITIDLPTCQKWSKMGKPIAALVPQAGLYEFSKDGRPTTVQQHLHEASNTRVQHPRMFGVRIGQSAVFPAEFCSIVPGQFYKRILSEEQRTQLVGAATKRPAAKLDAINKAVSGTGQLFDYANSDFLRSIGMVVSSTPLTIQGEVIAPPQIIYNTPMTIRDGAWNVMGKTRLSQPVNIRAWGVIVFDPKADQRSGRAQKFIGCLHHNLNERGILVHPEYTPGSQKFHMMWADPVRWEQALNEIADKASYEDSTGKHKPNIIIVFLPASAAQLKKQIKYWMTAKRNIATQCMRSGKWEPCKDQYLNNVVLKINAKIGGANSYVAITEKILNNTMVVGCDVSHPPPSVETRPSISSVVASVDSRACFYTSKTQVQPPHVEMIQNLRQMIWDASEDYANYHKGRGAVPRLDHIIVFRDGVSEGEYERVATEEIGQIDDVLDRLGKVMPRPKLTFIVVTKRHHVRFFPMQGQPTNKSGNCPPGLVIDSELGSGNDFYLQSHSGLIGTSRPSHYIVLRNDMSWTPRQIQELCYYLCHVYASATRSVSIPAPVYYADVCMINVNIYLTC